MNKRIFQMIKKEVNIVVSKGKLSTQIKQICKKYDYESIGKKEFKSELRDIIQEHQDQTQLYQNIGMAVQGYLFPEQDFKLEIPKNKIWKMVDEVEPKIRENYLNWAEEMSK